MLLSVEEIDAHAVVLCDSIKIKTVRNLSVEKARLFLDETVVLLKKGCKLQGRIKAMREAARETVLRDVRQKVVLNRVAAFYDPVRGYHPTKLVATSVFFE